MNGALQAFFVKHTNNWVTRAYQDKDLLKFLVCNVHGVGPKFLKKEKKWQQIDEATSKFSLIEHLS
ncbi:hypothetical protein H5410_053792 [Solanum commersonii]|uniref:Uncharacterized protein n=1 Tax=Solanum commersonii TaxID=4109 RepID=A0A9J5X6U5_SOLCO|nr:hypothetical protein H5410_053792 [Solanum commersonii]